MTEKSKSEKPMDEELIVDYFEIISEEEPIKKIEKINIKSSPKKNYTVIGIRNNNMVLVDENGNGYMFPVGKKYKEVKVGEIVSLYALE